MEHFNDIYFRQGNIQDIKEIKALAIRSWIEYKDQLTLENWEKLSQTLYNENTYEVLLNTSECVLCESNEQIIGMAFLVPKGNPNEIYEEDWCHLRFVSVDPSFRGKKVGERLTRKCIEIASKNQEITMALHTAEIMKGARHIYKKIGFEILKEIEPRLGLRYWLYTLELQNSIEE